MVLDIHQFMAHLAQIRPVFHSEADFQHAFAWNLQKQFPDAKIRLEYPVLIDRWLYLDIWAEIEGKKVAVELKYKTKSANLTWDNETFRLKNHGAQDISRYDFIKDIQRVEQMVVNNRNTIGYAIKLTNDSSYWRSGGLNAVDAAFRIHETVILKGTLAWAEHVGIGTSRNRADAINLIGEYPLTWHQYSQLDGDRGEDFRYLALEVTKTAYRYT